MPIDQTPVNRSCAEHYNWGGSCDGWHLLKCADLSVIQERVPPGGGEIRHSHSRARQFFYVLSGTATLELVGYSVTLGAGDGIHVPPNTVHRFANDSATDVVFLVISSPSTSGDRTNVPQERGPCAAPP
jgi:quercetin dioxygenase-like cupin family protein